MIPVHRLVLMEENWHLRSTEINAGQRLRGAIRISVQRENDDAPIEILFGVITYPFDSSEEPSQRENYASANVIYRATFKEAVDLDNEQDWMDVVCGTWAYARSELDHLLSGSPVHIPRLPFDIRSQALNTYRRSRAKQQPER